MVPGFIDIHTHTKANAHEGLSVQNVMGHFESISDAALYSVGFHPAYLEGYSDSLSLVAAAAYFENIVAIGECGLDRLAKTDFHHQLIVFRQQIALANEVNKPLIIHCVRAFDDVIQCLHAQANKVPVIFHGFNNKLSVADRLLSLGYYLSFGHAISKGNFPAAEALRVAGADSFFLETDNAPVAISQIYSLAADVREISIEDLILQQHKNFKTVFAHDAGYGVAIEDRIINRERKVE